MAIKRFLAVLEPVLILSLAVLIGGIVFSILLGRDGHERTCPVNPCLNLLGAGGAPRRERALQTRGRLWARPGIQSQDTARGMTLIEILVVLVLIGVIMSIVGGNYIGQGEKAKARCREDRDRADRPDARPVQARGRPLSDDAGGPAGADHARPPGVTNWNGPYWKKATVPKDPWGNEYKYTSPGANGAYDIVSLGADGKEGGDGPNKDITSAQQ